MGRRKNRSHSKKGKKQSKKAKRKAQASSPQSSLSPPKKTLRMETAADTPGATSTPQKHTASVGTTGTPNNNTTTTSAATPVHSSLMASSISEIEALPSPQEIVAMTSTTPTESQEELNLQPLLDNLLLSELSNVSNEGRLIVQSITKILNFGLLAATTKYDDSLRLKNIQIAVLTEQNAQLHTKLNRLEERLNAQEKDIKDLFNKTDENDQYERRDTIIISGDELPDEVADEDPAQVVVSTLNRVLGLHTATGDINVAHRLGRKQITSRGESTSKHKRPIIVKLHSRMLKSNIIKQCITRRPKLYVNESLTPVRRAIYRRFLGIRREHKGLIAQLHTSDGSIVVKLKDEIDRHVISSDSSLQHFLKQYPVMFGAYNSQP